VFPKIRYIVFLFLYSCAHDNQHRIISDLVQNPLTATDDVDKVLLPKIQLDKDFFDFGKIMQNESITTEFKLKNIGEAALLIRSAKGSCGCTVPEWPREVVEVGQESVVKVVFNSGEKQGEQRQTVTLITNAIPSTKVLTIIGTVLVPEK
tara:strand:+ start:21966 stop:22415 length:450 start_codon:yes stop_codon:yes gene_type:complete